MEIVPFLLQSTIEILKMGITMEQCRARIDATAYFRYSVLDENASGAVSKYSVLIFINIDDTSKLN